MHKVYFAADHAGFELKQMLIERVSALGYEVEDSGAFVQDEEDDYPDFITPCAQKVAEENVRGEAARTFGIIIGGSGQGEAMCANRIPGVRAAVFYGTQSVIGALEIEGGSSEDGFDAVRLPRRHNDANVLSLGARFLSSEDAAHAVGVFLETSFSSVERHIRRLEKF